MEVCKRLYWFCAYCIRDCFRPMRIRGLLGLKLSAFQTHWFGLDVEPRGFPPCERALTTPNGLLAIGGRATADSLLRAFEAGIFICNQAYQPVKWWAPASRMILKPDELRIEKNVQRLIRNDRFRISFDTDFSAVVDACAQSRPGSPELWVLPLAEVYKELYRRNHAFSIEVWDEEDNLVGGLFGLHSGRCVSVESMFSSTSNASKVAITHLCAHLRHWNYPIIDMQLPTSHLESLGAKAIARERYMSLFAEAKSMSEKSKPWCIEVKPDNDGSPMLIQGDNKADNNDAVQISA